MASPSSGTATKAKRRAARACRFCRTRKIKCNAAEPVCANCNIYGKDCVYEPTDAAHAHPAQHAVRRLGPRSDRSSEPGPVVAPPPPPPGAAAGPDAVSPRPVSPPPPPPPSSSRPDGCTPPASTDNARVSRMVDSANGAPSYHGRTSALFEEPASERQASAVAARPAMPDDWIEKGLVADATKQRQLEEVNFRTGQLDMDGIDPELGMHLLSLHWNRQHHSFLITYRPAFMRDMACGGPYFSKLLLNAIYFGASKFSPRKEVRRDPADVRTAGWQFRQRVRELLGQSLDRSDITTIQALLIMTSSLFALGDERSAAWLYAGIAFRMIIDLGMHVDPSELTHSRRYNDEDLEIRRRVFWGAFVVDKMQSLYQGRPVTLKESDTLVPIKFLDTYEELEYWMPFAYTAQSETFPGSPAYSVSTFTALCRLAIIMSDILSSIYTERSFDQPAAELRKLQDKLHDKLTAWSEALPPHLRLDSGITADKTPPPHVFSLHAMYHVLLILLHRPFVADGHLYSTMRSASVSAFMSCASAASEIVRLIRIYHHAFSVKRAPYLISYATYVAATIHVRIAATRSSTSGSYGSLETCLAVFMENSETNSAVRRAGAIVRTLMERFNVTLPEGHRPQVGSVRHDSTRAYNSPSLATTSASGSGPAAQTSRSNPELATAAAASSFESPVSMINTDGSIGGTVASTSNLDIDQIIQSFGRTDNYYSQQPGQIYEEQQLQHRDASDVRFDGMAGNTFNNSQGSHGPVPYLGLYNWRAVPGPDNMGNPAAAAAAIDDDPLFGFNGAALDQFTQSGMFMMGEPM